MICFQNLAVRLKWVYDLRVGILKAYTLLYNLVSFEAKILHFALSWLEIWSDGADFRVWWVPIIPPGLVKISDRLLDSNPSKSTRVQQCWLRNLAYLKWIQARFLSQHCCTLVDLEGLESSNRSEFFTSPGGIVGTQHTRKSAPSDQTSSQERAKCKIFASKQTIVCMP